MPARRARQKGLSRASCATLAAASLAMACGRFGYDPELQGVYGFMPDAAPDGSGMPMDAADGSVNDASAGVDGDDDGSNDGTSLDASADSDGPSMKEAGFCPMGIELSNPRQTALHGGTG